MASDSGKSKTRQQIDENLKRVYDEALQKEVPEKFLDLISQLKMAELKAGKGNNDDS